MDSDFYEEKHCSPIKGTNFSCFNDKQIKKLAKGINKLSKRNKKIAPIKIKARSIEDIYHDIEDVVKQNTGCEKEACVLSLEDLMKIPGMEELKEQVKVVQPGEWEKDVKDNRWVSNYEIDDILFKDDDNKRNFYYYGAVPIDFSDCGVSNLCSFNLKRHIKDKHHEVAAVFNTGDSKSDGHHWISMFLDILGKKRDGPCIYYFDSYGREPGGNVKKLIDKITDQANKMNMPMGFKYNKNPFQQSGYECGMYAIHFIKEMLKGLQFEDILNSQLMNDRTMVKLRDADEGGYLIGHHVMKGGRLTKKRSKNRAGKKGKKSKKRKKKTTRRRRRS